jgi:hypothetical protein
MFLLFKSQIRSDWCRGGLSSVRRKRGHTLGYSITSVMYCPCSDWSDVDGTSGTAHTAHVHGPDQDRQSVCDKFKCDN